jgi:hypothetical protein
LTERQRKGRDAMLKALGYDSIEALAASYDSPRPSSTAGTI